MGALVGGIIALILGIIGIIGWWTYFVDLLMGGIPFLLILGGGVAVAAGISDIKDKMEETKEKEAEKKEESPQETQTAGEEVKK